LYGFAADEVEVHGHIELRTTFTDGASSRTTSIRYLVLNAPSTYNILLGRPTLNRLGAVPSMRHMKMKLPSLEGAVITIKSDQKKVKRCYENNLKTKRGVFSVTTRPLREDGVTREEITRENRPEPAGGVVEREIGGKMFKLGQSLRKESQDQVAKVIARHLDAFASTAVGMLGIDPDFLCHRLTMDPKTCSLEKAKIQRRKASGHLREIQYPEWLAKVVLIQKANGK